MTHDDEQSHIARAAAALDDPDVTREAHPRAVDPLREASDVTAREAVERLVTVARRQVESMCEGFCKNLPSAGFFTEDMEHDCAVCRMRAALASAPQPAPAPTHECPICEEDVAWSGPDTPYCGECAADNGRDVKMRPIAAAPQPDETLAWAVFEDDETFSFAFKDKDAAEYYCSPANSIVRVAIRRVEDEA